MTRALCIALVLLQMFTQHSVFASNFSHHRVRNLQTIRLWTQKGDKRFPAKYKGFHFSAFESNFDLEVKEHFRPAVVTKFEAFAAEAGGSKRPLLFDSGRFVSGVVKGEYGSYFALHEENDGKFAGAVFTSHNKFYIDPIPEGHLQFSSNSAQNHDHFVYKLSDVDFADFDRHKELRRSAYTSFINDVGLQSPVSHANFSKASLDFDHSRVKRDARPKDTCQLLVVADYTFCQAFGQGNPVTTTNFLINMFSRVDSIYRATSFEGLMFYGLEVRTIHVSCEPTSTGVNPDGSPVLHYNMATERHTFKAQEFLLMFATATEFNSGKYCLAHLATARQFNGIYGLGMVADSEAVDNGGICSSYFNVAWSTHIDMNGVRMLAARSDVLVGHEIGHNWGSQHDPITDECSPSNNRFMMYAYAMPGYDSNNKQFSPCSIRSVAAVLRSKSDWCFVAQSQSYCGNSVVEDGEQCDAGYEGLQGDDPCCSSTCQLKSGAECADTNMDCCVNCKPASSDVECFEVSSSSSGNQCIGPQHCAGASSTQCLPGQPVREGLPCLDQGVCKAGTCIPFCESRGLVSCACSNVSVSCFRCCRDGADVNSQCVPWTNSSAGNTLTPTSTYIPVIDYQPCTIGYCLNSVCQQKVTSLTDRLWKFLANVDVNTVAVFMSNNLVGTIIVFSLVVWLPVSIAIACVDHRNYAAKLREAEQFIASSRTASANLTRQNSIPPNPDSNSNPNLSVAQPLEETIAKAASASVSQSAPIGRPLRTQRPVGPPSVPPVDYGGPRVPPVDYLQPAAPKYAAANPSFTRSETSLV